MAKLVTTGATMKCTFGVAPSNLVIPPTNRVNASNKPVATIMDMIPMTNIPPFGLCTSPSNPAVSAASSPQPCVPVISAPWSPGSNRVMMSKKPALDSNSQCMCSWSGIITFTQPGQLRVDAK